MVDSDKRGLQASVDGFAHEHIVAGILMKRYQNVSLVDLPLSPYDIIIVFKDSDGKENILRAQVKTATRGITFTGGSRGGVDRQYISGVKEYTQSTKTSDLVIGIHPRGEDSFDLYFVPTICIEQLRQKSISLRKIEVLKNNYEMLEKCKDGAYVTSKCKEFGIIR
ncbi:hypothetical protein ACFLW0_04725 [Chloroflexota bacterium]